MALSPTSSRSSGGGSIAVTDGVRTVSPATTLKVYGGVVADAGGGEADYSSSPRRYDYVTQATDLSTTASSAATATVFVTGNSVTYDGTTTVVLEFFCASVNNTGGAAPIAELYDNGVDTGIRLGQGNASNGTPWLTRYLITPSAGAHVYSVRIWRAGGTSVQFAGTSGGVYAPAYLMQYAPT